MLPAVPGTGDAIPMPNMEVDQPIATGIIPANAAGYMAALSGDQAALLEEGGLLGGGIPSGRTFGVPTSEGNDGISANTVVGIGQGLGNRFVNQRPFGAVHLGNKLADEPFKSSFAKSYRNTPTGRFWADTTPDHLSRVTRHGAIITPLSFPGTVTGTPPGVQRANLLGRIYGNAYTNNPVAALAGSRLAMTEDAANAAMKLAQAGGTTSLQSKTGAALRGLIRSLSTPAAIGLNLGLYSPNAGDPFLDTPGYAEKYAADQQAQFDEARLSELQALDALNEAHAQSVLASGVTQQPAYTGGDPTIPGLNVSSALANPNISVQATQEEADARAAEYMAAAADTQDIMMAGGTLGGGMPFAGAVTGAEALINEAPFVSANPLSVLAKTGMMSNLANFDARPAVQEVFDTIMPTTQAAPVAAPVAAPAPTGPSAAEIERQRQAAINARLAQEATARQQQQQAAAVQQAIEFERMSKRLANLRGRDRGVDPSEVAALEAALGGYRGDPAGRQAGGGRGGFDPQGGTTGSSGMGAWT